jgi:PAS domain S-box-containing protein
MKDGKGREGREQEWAVHRELLERAQAFGRVGSWVADPAPDGRIVWSDETCRIFGCKPGEFDGSAPAFFAMVHEEDRERVRQSGRAAMVQGDTYELEYRIVRRDGEVRWLHQRAGLDRDADGRPWRKVGMVQDITERKTVEEALANEQGRLKAVLDNAPMGIWLLGTDGRLRFVNATFCQAMGVTEERFLAARHYRDVLEPAMAAGCEASDRACWAQETPHCSEERVRFADGAEHVLEITKVKLRSSSGKVLGLIGLANDITERRRAEEAQRRQERVMLGLIEYLRTLLQGKGPIESVAARAFGALGEALGVDRVYLFELHDNGRRASQRAEWVAPGVAPQIDDPAFQNMPRNQPGFERWDALLGRGEVVQGHVRDFPEGERSVLEPQGIQSTLVVPFEAGGGVGGFLGFDICREKRDFTRIEVELLEGAARSLGEAIERRRAAEEREKLQEQLAQARRTEAVGRLAGGVAHDFNNMLQTILGHASLAIEVLPKGSDVRENLEVIRQSARRSAGLTRQLLAFARKQTIQPRVLDLNETVGGMLKMLRPLIGEHIHLEWSPGEAPWRVKVDPSQIDQILVNLCVNARDAIRGVGQVEIKTANVTVSAGQTMSHSACAPGEYMMLAVQDTGMGMDTETLAQIFEPFFTTKEPGQGTGLGLATVFGIVRQNGGAIDVCSQPGRGTIFRVYLPRCQGDVAGVGEAPVTTSVPEGRAETVLLVEDEESILMLTRLILRQQGYRVLAAVSPVEALVLADRHAGPIDLLVTDVVMPGMNGKELCDRLQKNRPGLRCLYTSGYTADVLEQHGVLDDAVRFLQKPFSNEEFTRKVQDVLATGGPRQVGRGPEPDLKRSAQKDLQDAQPQFPSFSFSSLPSVGRTEGNEGNREQRRGI